VDAGGYDAGWYDPYGYDWGLPVTTEWWPGPYEAWSGAAWSGAYGATTSGGQPVASEAQEARGASAAEAGSGVTAYWHGNPGY
jgi:hypothetical protein